MNEQSIFNRAVKGLASQGFKRCVNADDHCKLRYRGRKCAVGWLIPDEKYKCSMESASGVAVYNAERYCKGVGLSKAYVPFIQLLADLQTAHDQSRCPEDMKDRLRDVAETRGLTLPKVLQ